MARAALQKDDMEVVAINDPCFENEHVNHLNIYGRSHGKWEYHGFSIYRDTVLFGEEKKYVKKFAYRNRTLIPWAQTGAEFIVETSNEVIGKSDALSDVHIKDGGAKKVIIAAYSEDAPVFVVGVNEHEYKSKVDIVSAGSRTTNCLAPLVMVMHDRFGIIEGLITIYHSSTSNQQTYDMTLSRDQVAINAAKAVMRVIPSINGKLRGNSKVIPTLGPCMAELLVTLEKQTTYSDILAAIEEESLLGILGFINNDDRDKVSRGFIGDKRSCFIDPNSCILFGKNTVKFTVVYNNEWGYCSRVVDLIAHMAKTC